MFVKIKKCCQKMKVHTYYSLFVVNRLQGGPKDPHLLVFTPLCNRLPWK